MSAKSKADVAAVTDKTAIQLSDLCVQNFSDTYARLVQHIMAAHGGEFAQVPAAAYWAFGGQIAGHMSANPNIDEAVVRDMAQKNFDQAFEQAKAAREAELRGGKLDA